MEILKKLRNSLNLKQNELANILSVEQVTITQYEASQYYPSFKVIERIVNHFKVSFDYLLLEDQCFYPRNLDFIRLADQLDNFSKPESRNNIEITIRNILGDKINKKIDIKLDKIDIDLEDNFHANLKILRKHKKITQKQVAEHLNIESSVVSRYEKSNHPTVERMIKLSQMLDISIHALVTGEKLFYDFQDRHFGKTILLADHFLSIDDKNFLIKLMENIVNSGKS